MLTRRRLFTTLSIAAMASVLRFSEPSDVTSMLIEQFKKPDLELHWMRRKEIVLPKTIQSGWLQHPNTMEAPESFLKELVNHPEVKRAAQRLVV